MTDAELIQLFYDTRFALYADGLDLMDAEHEAILTVVNKACERIDYSYLPA